RPPGRAASLARRPRRRHGDPLPHAHSPAAGGAQPRLSARRLPRRRGPGRPHPHPAGAPVPLGRGRRLRRRERQRLLPGGSMSALPRYDDGFFDAEERALGDRFLEAGYLILPAEDRRALDRIRDRAAAIAAAKLGVEAGDPDRFLNRIHERVDAAGLNELRLAVIDGLNAEPWLRPSYHRLARRALAAVVGNELAMQRRLNLSIQMPHDASSLLPVHADSWDGDSPFEVVLWVPLVDCRRTKSMFLVPPEKGRAVEAGFRR